jgi:dipeptidase E
MRRLLLLSTSTVYGRGFLEYCDDELRGFLGGVGRLVFVPYAQPSGVSHDQYTKRVRAALARLDVDVVGLHEADPTDMLESAEAVFVGGGNTFLLLRELYATGAVPILRARVAAGMPYMGASAGSNVAGLTINTTNDMPIVFPPSFDALGLIPFNINPHYVDPDPNSTHMGETRETRIHEFHMHASSPVLGLREGAMLNVDGPSAEVLGVKGGRLFRSGEDPVEIPPGSDVSYLL